MPDRDPPIISPRDPSAPLDLLFGGRVFCDLVMSGVRAPRPGEEVFAESFTIAPGGTATRAVAAARLGWRTGLTGVVGRDAFGGLVTDALAAEARLDLSWLEHHPSAHTAVTVALTDGVDRSFVTYEEAATAAGPGGGPAPLPHPLPAVGLCHVGLAEGLPDWLAPLRAGGTVVVGGVGWDETEVWSGDVLDRLACVDAFVPNEVEALNYTRTQDPPTAARALVRRVGTVCVTRGAQGAYALDATTGELADVPGRSVPVVDPTGAGDVFVASFGGARLRGWSLTTCTAFAVLCSSLSVQRPGGASSAPTRAEVARALADARERRDLPPAEWDVVSAWLAA